MLKMIWITKGEGNAQCDCCKCNFEVPDGADFDFKDTPYLCETCTAFVSAEMIKDEIDKAIDAMSEAQQLLMNAVK